MKQKLFYLAVAALAIFSTVSYYNNRSEAAISSPAGPAFTSFPCATGYVAAGPNFCLSTGINSAFNATLNMNAGCQQQSYSNAGVPATAKAILVQLTWNALASGAAGGRFNSLTIWTTPTCINTINLALNPGVREPGGIFAAGTVLHQDYFTVVVTPCAVNTMCTTTVNTGGNGNVSWSDLGGTPPTVLGYWL